MNPTKYKEIAEVPVENADQDKLGLSAYSASLAAFIKNCVTPTTIAVQGDWGSGKTSLLHMISSTLNPAVLDSKKDKDNCEEYLCIDFNTWQYSQFEMSDSLSITFLTCFLNALQEKMDKSPKISSTMDTVKKVTASFAKRAAIYTVGKLGGDELKGAAEEALDIVSGEPSKDVVDLTKKLKEQINDCIDEVIKSGKKRIVVFIDDLDRLNPVKAVELLEIIKIFLDCPNCVYVLAVDTNVIKHGIVQKYGLSEEKSHAFFEKLIQLPFVMPISYYRFDEFARSIFPSDGDLNYQVDFFDRLSSDDQARCITLLTLASDKNPRVAKRIINSFVLLDMVSRKNQPIPGDEDESAKYRAKAKLLLALTCIQVKLEPDYRTIIDMAAFHNRFSRWLCSNDLLIYDALELQRKFSYSPEQVDSYMLTKNACYNMITIFKRWCLDFNELNGNDGKALQTLLQSTNEKERKNTGANALLARSILNEFENTFRDIRREVILDCLENQKENRDYSLWYNDAVKLLTSRPKNTTHFTSQEMLDKINMLIQTVDLDRVDEESISQVLDLYESLDSVKFHYTYTNLIEESFLESAGDHVCAKYRVYKRAEECIDRYLKVLDIFSSSPSNGRWAFSRLIVSKLTLKQIETHLNHMHDYNDELRSVYIQLKDRIQYFFAGVRLFLANQKNTVFSSSTIPSLFAFSLMAEGEDAQAFTRMETVLLGKGDSEDYANGTPTSFRDLKWGNANKEQITAKVFADFSPILLDSRQCCKNFEAVRSQLPFGKDDVFDASFGWLMAQLEIVKAAQAKGDTKPDKEELSAYGKQRLILLFGISSALAYLESQEQYQESICTFRETAGPDFNDIFRAVDIIEQEYFAAATDDPLRNPAIFLGVSPEALSELQLAVDNTDGWQFEDLSNGYLELTLGMVRDFLSEPAEHLSDNRGSYELGMLIGRHFDENASPHCGIVYTEEHEDGTKTHRTDYCCFEKREGTFLWKYYEVFVKVINCLRVYNNGLQEMFSKHVSFYDPVEREGVLGAETDRDFSELQHDIHFTIRKICQYDHILGIPPDCDMDLAKHVKSTLESIHSIVANELFEAECSCEVVLNCTGEVANYFVAMGSLIYREIPQFVNFVETGHLSTDSDLETEIFERLNPHHKKFWKKYNDVLELLRELADT